LPLSYGGTRILALLFEDEGGLFQVIIHYVFITIILRSKQPGGINMRYSLVVCLSIFILISQAACVSTGPNPIAPKQVDSPPVDCSIVVTNMLPEGFADTTRPVISAALSSKCGNNIDLESIEILVNDEAVQVEATSSGGKISVEHTLEWNLAQNSDHYIMIRAKDKKGNSVEKEWSFYVGLIY
jgi:hypothetical protein